MIKSHKIPVQNRDNSLIVSRRLAKTLRKITLCDAMYLGFIIAFAVLTIWSGNKKVTHLTPAGAISVSGILDNLQMPRQLPNAPLKDDDGDATTLYELCNENRTVVSFYAPWCGPCQKELPLIIKKTKKKKNLIILVSRDEDLTEVRKKLDELGFNDVKFYMDITGKIYSDGKIKSLPTTFLITKRGKVLQRVIGYSNYRLNNLLKKAKR